MTAFRRWQDYGTMLLGVLLFISPFVFGDTSQTTAAWTAYIGGVLIFLSGLLAASLAAVRATEGVPVVLGVLLFISPWVLGFAGVTAIAWTAWVIGVLAVLVAGSVLLIQGRTASVAH
jgi:SPW repeat-containing protein